MGTKSLRLSGLDLSQVPVRVVSLQSCTDLCQLGMLPRVPWGHWGGCALRIVIRISELKHTSRIGYASGVILEVLSRAVIAQTGWISQL